MMKRIAFNQRLRRASYMAALLTSAWSAGSAQAVNLIWDGGAVSGDWGNGTNWQIAPGATDQLPVNGDSLFYTSTSNTQFGQTNTLAAGTQINGITFGVVPAGGTGGTSVGGFTIGGNSIVLTGDLLNSSSNPTATQTLNFNMQLSGATRTIFANATPALSNGGNTFDFTLGGAISGNSNLVVNLDANGQTRFNGATANTYTGNTTILAPSSVATASVFLGKTGGAVAIQGGTIVTMGSTAGTGQANLRMSANEQFGTSSGGVQMDFANPTGQWMRFDLLGTTQTLAGINTGNLTTQGSGVVQNGGIGVGSAANATLTLNGSGNYVFNGHMRNFDNVNSGGVFNLVKNGTGTQTLIGSVITHTGATTVNSGTLGLTDTINFASAIAVGAGGTLNSSRTAAGIGNRQDIMGNGITGSGIININNAANTLGTTDGGWSTVNGGTGSMNFAGTLNINSGVFSRDNVAVDTITGTATVNVAAGAGFGAGRGGNSTIGALNGAGDVGAFWAGANQGSITIGNGGGSGAFTGIIHGNGNATDGHIDGGTMSVNKTGAGLQSLSGINTYTGTTTINGGTLQIIGTGQLGAGNYGGAITNNAIFEFSSNAAQNLSGNITGTGTFTKSGNALMRFNGANQVISQAQINILGGILQNDNNSVNWSTNTGDMNIAGGAILDLFADAVFVDELTGTGTVRNNYAPSGVQNLNVGVANGSSTFGGTIVTGGGNVALIKHGTGTFTLTNAGTNYTGTTSVNAGKLELINTSGFNSATTVASGATLELDNTADRNYAGGFAITLNNGATLDNINPNNWTVINGAVNVSGNTTINHVANATGAAGRGLYLDGGLKGTGVVTINALSAGSGVNFRDNDSTFSGKIIVNGIASTTPFVGSGIGVGGNTSGLINADIELNGTMELLNRGIGWANSAPGDFFMGALSGSGVMVGNFTAGGQTRVRIGNNNNSGLFSGTIANGIGNVVVLTKNGTGTQTFSGINTYTGNTTIAAGTLALIGAGSIDNSPIISIASGATFDVEGVSNFNLTSIQTLIGNGTINGNMITDAGSTISPGASVGAIGTLTFLDNLDINGRLLIDVNGLGGGTTDLINVAGLLDVSGAILDFDLVNVIDDPFYIFASYGSLTGQFASITGMPASGYEVKYNFQGNNIALVSIPEPATMSLFALGSLALLRRSRKA